MSFVPAPEWDESRLNAILQGFADEKRADEELARGDYKDFDSAEDAIEWIFDGEQT